MRRETLRIAFVSYIYPSWTYGGAATYAQQLIEALAKLGHDVHLFAPKLQLNYSNSDVHYHSIHTGLAHLTGFLNFCSSLKNAIDYSSFDIIHSNSGPGLFLRRVDLETVHHIEDITGGAVSFFSGLLALSSAAFKSRHILTVSEDTKRSCLRFGIPAEKILSVVPNGVNPSKFYPQSAVDERFAKLRATNHRLILFVGDLVKRKRPHILIDILRKVSKKVPTKLLIVGHGPLEPSLDRYARINGVRDDVIFMEKVSIDKLRQLHSIADLFVLPSKVEGFALVLLESIACGTRFVSSNVGIAPTLAKAGFGYACNTIDQLVDNSVELLINPVKLGWKGHDYVSRNFSWRQTAERTLDTYRRILK